MKRVWHIWVAFGLALAVLLVGMGRVTLTALDLDRAQAEAQSQAEIENNVRLALWRMDYMILPVIAQENARPYFSYRAFYPAERAYNRMFEELQHGEILMPSPLLTRTFEHILLHFQFAPDGALTSPQAPSGNMRDRAEYDFRKMRIHVKIEAATARLDELRAVVSRDALLRALPKEDRQATVPEEMRADVKVEGANQAQPSQTARNISEYVARARTYQQAASQQRVATQRVSSSTAVREGVLRPTWVGDVLVLARRVSVNKQDYVQGCWLDWPGIRERLLADVKDLLPEASLVPLHEGGDDERARVLAALPVRLVPGAFPAEAPPFLSPVGLSLLIAWGCVLVAAVAVGVLLFGALSLSERRAAFVSAVTHELRTPLTTFQMYSEMLAEGMIAGEEKRRRYLTTLRAEAERLSHLVENVLAYARLERGRPSERAESIPLQKLLEGVRERLARRAARARMALVVETTEGGEPVTVQADVSAVEQILLNLVDNACKYAASASDKRIHLAAGRTDGFATLRVRDHGPGISSKDARRLFRPFSKSARDAAHSAPGVGLGLALSRRLARDMGGDLRLDEGVRDGACFVLSLAIA